jgi:hypothetical protein
MIVAPGLPIPRQIHKSNNLTPAHDLKCRQNRIAGGRFRDLVLRFSVKVACVMTLIQLARRIAIAAIDMLVLIYRTRIAYCVSANEI